ncbi:hypothetical protein [Bacteroides sp. 51]|uniref:hypothetical protein n=1 Tax=Bacteroides sp. 51 TaxID=2302938 RepID=UPI0013D337C9|nr:hypothetical protein [Bacteroides sp. 51]NDV80768.1 hypothetical protein [Bacteroides sp. 51]
MSLLIGIKQEDGIRYISVSTEYGHKFDKVVSILRNFYKSPEKVKTLIDLGNLHWLGPSPYNKSKGSEDLVNCEAIIRDRKLSPGKHGFCYTDTEENFVKKLDRDCHYGLNCCFLFDENEWHILMGGHKENIRTIDASVLKKGTRMEGLSVYEYCLDQDYNRLSGKDFYTWQEVRLSADESNKPYYIFRGEKLLTIIHPNTNKAS